MWPPYAELATPHKDTYMKYKLNDPVRIRLKTKDIVFRVRFKPEVEFLDEKGQNMLTDTERADVIDEIGRGNCRLCSGDIRAHEDGVMHSIMSIASEVKDLVATLDRRVTIIEDMLKKKEDQYAQTLLSMDAILIFLRNHHV